ncbi:MAG: pyridoxamine 5'-phosphate oxidase family protein [Acidimicrobiales bacterium]|nr:pyridoxamine 5'-phosphate oxidase family protein [Acidimicrobiales bacterium]
MSDANLDRLGLEVLSPDECWQLLADAPVGRVAFVDAGEPVVFPVTHTVHGHSVVFRTGSGTKLEAAKMSQAIAFEADAWDASDRRGWSVLVRGVGETVYEDGELAELESSAAGPWLDSATQGVWVRIRADEISGRRLSP